LGIIYGLQKHLFELRSNSPLADRILSRIADICTDLFGEAETDLVTLHHKLEQRTQQLRVQDELLKAVPDGFQSGVFTDEQPTLESSRLIDWKEMDTEPMIQAAQDLGLDPKDTNRRIWEKSAVLHLLRLGGFLDPKKRGLGIGVGTESLPFYLSRYCDKIIGIDKYESEIWQSAGMSPEEVYESASIPFERERLLFRDCDMRSLEFQDNEFDFVWSISSIEHVSAIDEYLRVYEEISRVLKPGGKAFITTEWNLVANNPVYAPGLIALDTVLYPWLVAQLRNLQPVDRLNPTQKRNLNHVMATKFRDPLGRTIRPSVVNLSCGSFLTPVLLIFHKPLSSETD